MNQPNILILHCDQLRQDCLGFNGNADVRIWTGWRQTV